MKLFWDGSGQVGNSDNRANSVQLPVQLQAGTELGKITDKNALKEVVKNEEDMDEGKEAEDSNLAIKKCRIDISTKVIASTNVDVSISTH